MRKSLNFEMKLFFLFFSFSLVLFFLDKKGQLIRVRGWLEPPVLALEKKVFFWWRDRPQMRNPWQACTVSEQQLFNLEGRLRQLAVEQNQLVSCQEENEAMRRLLGAPLPPSWQFLPAEVVGFKEQLQLNQGSENGVAVGMAVVSEEVLVGRVEVVTPRSSLVRLPTTPGTKIPVVVKQPGSQTGVQARGLLVAESTDQLVLDGVLQDEDIQKGDLVVTGAQSNQKEEISGWLTDLVIGQIEEVLPKSAHVYQKAKVLPLVDFQELSHVFIITKE